MQNASEGGLGGGGSRRRVLVAARMEPENFVVGEKN